jgi:hypothetical protein
VLRDAAAFAEGTVRVNAWGVSPTAVFNSIPVGTTHRVVEWALSNSDLERSSAPTRLIELVSEEAPG